MPVPVTFFGTPTLKYFEKIEIRASWQKQLQLLHTWCQVEAVKIVKLFYNLNLVFEQPLADHGNEAAFPFAQLFPKSMIKD